MWEFASAYFSETAKMSVSVCVLLKCMPFLLGINRNTGKEEVGLNKRGEEKGIADMTELIRQDPRSGCTR